MSFISNKYQNIKSNAMMTASDTNNFNCKFYFFRLSVF